MIDMREQYGMEACYESVVFDVEVLKINPFEQLGRYYVRSKVDIFFNKTMIKAMEKYIFDHDLRWDSKIN